MSNTTINRRQVLMAVGVVLLVAVLATQTYTLAASGGAKGVNAIDPTATNYDTISVSAVGQVDVQPDRAIVNIGVTTQGATAQEAVQQNANRMSSVISAIEGAGVSNSSIHTTYYSISPQQSCCGGGAPTITGYQVTNQVQVTVLVPGSSMTQLGDRVGKVIDAASSQGANQFYGIQFTASTSTLRQAQQTALQQAVKNASQEAHLIASAAGVSIKGVLSLSINPNYNPPIYAYPVAALQTAVSTPVVPPQSLSVTATVQVVYSIG